MSKASLESDQEYKDLRKQIVEKEFTAGIVGIAGLVALGTAAVLGMGAAGFALPLINTALTAYAGIAIVGAVVTGVLGAGLLVSNFRRETALEIDRDELNMLRRAKHLSTVMDKTHNPAMVIAAEAQMDQERQNNKWRDKVRDEQKTTAADLASSLIR